MRASVRSTAILLLLSAGAPIRAEDAESNRTPVDDAAIRQAVINATVFLDTGGAELEKGASCINCHHAPLRRWALHEADRAGIQVDLDALQRLTANQLQKLAELQDDYRDKQWGHSLSAFYVLGNVDDVSSTVSGDLLHSLTDIIVVEQSADGSWKAAQQFANQRRPGRDADQVQTMWSVLALSAASGAEVTAARNRGLEWLNATEPGTTIDARALRVLIERQWGQPERRQQALMQLLKTQRPDGGWGWQPDDPGEAWATGLALYALSQSNEEELASVIDRGRSFLLNTQQADGSWQVQGKLTANSDMSSYFGTVWAIVGLCRALPPDAH
jgi:squalene-hopene/tetraprenyl-beta-curcumene cyclase